MIVVVVGVVGVVLVRCNSYTGPHLLLRSCSSWKRKSVGARLGKGLAAATSPPRASRGVCTGAGMLIRCLVGRWCTVAR
eukprot:8021051-Pyramimonas_sp.AAC.1